MLDSLLIFAAVVIGGFGFWLRGSALFYNLTGRGATTARLVAWAMPLALLSLFVVSPLYALSIGVALFLGSILPWWKSLSLGRNSIDGTWAESALRHTGRGVLWTLPLSVVVFFAVGGYSFLLPLLTGALVVVPYEIGWRIQNEKLNPTEIGEIGFGAMIGLSLFLSLV